MNSWFARNSAESFHVAFESRIALHGSLMFFQPLIVKVWIWLSSFNIWSTRNIGNSLKMCCVFLQGSRICFDFSACTSFVRSSGTFCGTIISGRSSYWCFFGTSWTGNWFLRGSGSGFEIGDVGTQDLSCVILENWWSSLLLVEREWVVLVNQRFWTRVIVIHKKRVGASVCDWALLQWTRISSNDICIV